MLACAAHRRAALRRVRRVHRRVAARPHQRRARPRCSSPPTARGGAARSSRSRRSPTKRSRTRRRSSTSLVLRRTENDVAMQDGRDVWWHDAVAAASRPSARPSRWTAKTCCSSSTPRAPPGSPRASCTRPAATSRRSRSRTSTCSTCTPTPTSTGAPPTSAGSPATRTSCTARSRTARRACSTRARPTIPDKDRFWSIVEKYKVTIFYTAPTAIRTFMKWGDEFPRRTRPLVAAPARLGRRADQPRGVGLVLQGTSAASAARSSTRGGRPRPARS